MVLDERFESGVHPEARIEGDLIHVVDNCEERMQGSSILCRANR